MGLKDSVKDGIKHAIKMGRVAQAYEQMLLLTALMIVPEDLSTRLRKRFDEWELILIWALNQHDPQLFRTAWEARFEDIIDVETAFRDMNPQHLENIEHRPLSPQHQKALDDGMARGRQLNEGRISSVEDLNEALKTHDPLDVLESIVTGRPLTKATKEPRALSPEELRIQKELCARCPPDKKAACTATYKQPDPPNPTTPTEKNEEATP